MTPTLLRADLTSDLHSHKQQWHADFEDLSKKLNQQAATLQNQLQQIHPPSPDQPAQAQPALVQPAIPIPRQIDVNAQVDCTKSISSTKSKEPEGDHISTKTPMKSAPDDSPQLSQTSQMTHSRISRGGIRPRKYPHPKGRVLDDAEITSLSHCEHEESKEEEERQRELYHREQHQRTKEPQQ